MSASEITEQSLLIEISMSSSAMTDYKHANALMKLAHQDRVQKLFSNAENLYRRAMDLDPALRSEAIIGIARVLLEKGYPREALAMLPTIQCGGGDRRYYVTLIDALMRCGDTAGARSVMNTALKSGVSPAEISQISEMLEAFEARGGIAMFASCVHQNAMWIFGGWKIRGVLSDCSVKSADGETWQDCVALRRFEPRCYHSALSFNGSIWVLGGFCYGPPSNVFGDVWVTKDGVRWTCVLEHAPWEAREHFGAVILGNRMLVFGGVTYLNPNQSSGLRCFSDVWTSSDGYTWSCIAEDAPFGERRGFGCAVLNDRVYLMGGADSSGRLYNDVWSSSDGRTWRCETLAAEWKPRVTAFAGALNGKLIIMGGNTSETSIDACGDVWVSDDGQAWTCATLEAPWTPRAGSNPVVISSDTCEQLFLIGGFRQEKDFEIFSDIWSTFNGKDWIDTSSESLKQALQLPSSSL